MEMLKMGTTKNIFPLMLLLVGRASALLDLPVNLHGRWVSNDNNTQFIWQSCLELTITTDTGTVFHHQVMDGDYVTRDIEFDGQSIEYTTHIEVPTDQELADGAKATVVMRDVSDSSIILARRYVDENGRLKFSRFLSPLITFSFEYERDELACDGYPIGYDPVECASETDHLTDTTERWTMACCADEFALSILEPFYDNGYNPTWQLCDSQSEVGTVESSSSSSSKSSLGGFVSLVVLVGTLLVALSRASNDNERCSIDDHHVAGSSTQLGVYPIRVGEEIVQAHARPEGLMESCDMAVDTSLRFCRKMTIFRLRGQYLQIPTPFIGWLIVFRFDNLSVAQWLLIRCNTFHLRLIINRSMAFLLLMSRCRAFGGRADPNSKDGRPMILARIVTVDSTFRRSSSKNHC